MKMTKRLVPDKSIFKNREKEAKFWEKHFAEACTVGKTGKAAFAKNLSETVNIRLDTITLTIVRSEAKAKGLGPTQLIRMWIMEKIGEKYNPPARL